MGRHVDFGKGWDQKPSVFPVAQREATLRGVDASSSQNSANGQVQRFVPIKMTRV